MNQSPGFVGQLIGSIAALGGNVGNHSLLNGGKSVRFLQADADPQRMQGGRETVNDVNDATVNHSGAVQVSGKKFLSEKRRAKARRQLSPQDFGESQISTLEHLRPLTVGCKGQAEQEEATPSELLRECVSLCGSLQEALQAPVLKVALPKEAAQFSSQATIGIMLNGLEIENTVIGGPAYNTRKLDKGDLILEVDAVPMDVERLHEGVCMCVCVYVCVYVCVCVCCCCCCRGCIL